jgi:hypothetical protein
MDRCVFHVCGNIRTHSTFITGAAKAFRTCVRSSVLAANTLPFSTSTKLEQSSLLLVCTLYDWTQWAPGRMPFKGSQASNLWLEFVV